MGSHGTGVRSGEPRTSSAPCSRGRATRMGGDSCASGRRPRLLPPSPRAPTPGLGGGPSGPGWPWGGALLGSGGIGSVAWTGPAASVQPELGTCRGLRAVRESDRNVTPRGALTFRGHGSQTRRAFLRRGTGGAAPGCHTASPAPGDLACRGIPAETRCNPSPCPATRSRFCGCGRTWRGAFGRRAPLAGGPCRVHVAVGGSSEGRWGNGRWLRAGASPRRAPEP